MEVVANIFQHVFDLYQCVKSRYFSNSAENLAGSSYLS
jgi:hypothetical protein